MAQFAHYANYTIDSAGNALTGVSIAVRKQGATVNGGPQSSTTITVRDTGGIADGDICRVNAGTSDVGTVLSHDISTITFDQSVSVNDLDRITPRNNLPTLYDEATGADSKPNPLSSAATGLFEYWARGGAYDHFFSGGGMADTLVRDVWLFGSNLVASTHGSPAWILDTDHTPGGTALLLSIRNQGVEKFTFKQDGTLTIQQQLVVAAGGASITGPITSVTSLTMAGALSGVTSLTMSGALSGATSLSTTGDLTVRRMKASQGTTLVAGDFALSGWGAGILTVLGPSKDSVGAFNIFSGTGSANPTVTLTFKDGGFNNAIAIVTRTSNSDQPTVMWTATQGATTAVQFTFRGTPVAGENLGMQWVMIDH